MHKNLDVSGGSQLQSEKENGIWNSLPDMSHSIHWKMRQLIAKMGMSELIANMVHVLVKFVNMIPIHG